MSALPEILLGTAIDQLLTRLRHRTDLRLLADQSYQLPLHVPTDLIGEVLAGTMRFRSPLIIVEGILGWVSLVAWIATEAAFRKITPNR